jgi:ABC-2 type transport system ATP-binding protein
MVLNDMPAVRLTNVTKRYADLTAVDNLGLDIGKGEVLGLLGPNGSGKSTTMKMMLGLLAPSSGTVSILGYNVVRNPIDVRRRVGYVPESPRVYEFLTALEFLDPTGDVYGMTAKAKKERIHEFIGAFDLEGREGDIISSYSDGMK